ncbi:MAG TPA: PDZ domain-containing protein [Pirellulaceae bacterium]|nr:PDZ domain-containing protein [Pirellulaceae bacterium]
MIRACDLFALTVALALAISAAASAQDGARASISGLATGRQPRLGIYGKFDDGFGLAVDRVRWGTPAARLGLEAGDVIRAINGHWLRNERDYWRQLRDSKGEVRLVVVDVRTGRLISRNVFIGPRYADFSSSPAAYGGDPNIGRFEK